MQATHSGKAKVTLPSATEILIEREFDAPARLVWRAVTEPDLIRGWWAGQRGTVTTVEVDLRVGGAWRYVMVAHGDLEVAFHGTYQELAPGRRLVTTEVFEGMPDASALNTVTLTETADGRTRLTVLVRHARPEDRDAHIASGMEGGMQEAYDRLEQVTQGLATG